MTTRTRRASWTLALVLAAGACGGDLLARSGAREGASQAARANAGGLGLFTDHTDVGTVKQAGTARVSGDAASARGGRTRDANAKTNALDASAYDISGSGANIWGTTDAFHFLWRRTRGDLTLTTDVTFDAATAGANAHRKAGWMIRASLDPDAPYADAVQHGDGSIALQYRSTAGGQTAEIRSPITAPATLRLERHGSVISMEVARPGGVFQPVGALVLALPDEVYAGLFVSAHDNERVETAHFSAVTHQNASVADTTRILESTLETMDVTTGERRIVYRAREHFEAPNWSRDGNFLVFNRQGGLFRIPVGGGTPAAVDVGGATRLNNDHGFSPDGTWIAISHSPERQSLISIVPAAGGSPARLITPTGPSYWHGWSPDGRTLAYCAQRNGEFDIYTIPAEGGSEQRLTTATGLDDGPDYSPDGKYIYFNSERSGLMHIWRMAPDGSNQEQITSEEAYADWFAHPSPDGKAIIFLSFDKSVKGHPANQDVVLRLMPTPGSTPATAAMPATSGSPATAPKIIARLFGGQGTINVPSWAPDSRRVAFVSYRLVGPEPAARVNAK